MNSPIKEYYLIVPLRATRDYSIIFLTDFFFEYEYLGVIKTEFENMLACLSGVHMGFLNLEQNRGKKYRDRLPFTLLYVLEFNFMYAIKPKIPPPPTH